MKTPKAAMLECLTKWRATPGVDNLNMFVEAAIEARDAEHTEALATARAETEAHIKLGQEALQAAVDSWNATEAKLAEARAAGADLAVIRAELAERPTVIEIAQALLEGHGKLIAQRDAARAETDTIRDNARRLAASFNGDIAHLRAQLDTAKGRLGEARANGRREGLRAAAAIVRACAGDTTLPGADPYEHAAGKLDGRAVDLDIDRWLQTHPGILASATPVAAGPALTSSDPENR